MMHSKGIINNIQEKKKTTVVNSMSEGIKLQEKRYVYFNHFKLHNIAVAMKNDKRVGGKRL